MSFKHKLSKEENKLYVQKARSLRIDLSHSQERAVTRFFGVRRYVYNKALSLILAYYKENKKYLDYLKLAKMLTEWRELKPWVAEAPVHTLQATLQHLDAAFRNFFRGIHEGKRVGFPKFKSKRGEQSLTYPSGVRLDLERRKVRVPKLGWLLCYNLKNLPEGEIYKATLRRSATGKYYLNVAFKSNVKLPTKQSVTKESTFGMDLGLISFITLRNGEKVNNSKFITQFAKRLRRASRNISRAQKGSYNQKKAYLKKAALQEKLVNKRTNFLHALTRKLVNDNQVTCFKIEDLNIEGMMKNHHLAASIQDACWGEFVRQLEYKANWLGKTVEKIGRFYPSSKLCSKCKYYHKSLKLSDRFWTCPKCGAYLDRDSNAQVNIENYDTAGTAGIYARKPSKRKSLRREPVALNERGNLKEVPKLASGDLSVSRG